jgi:hypothetical protein
MKARISEQNTDGWQEVVARNDLCVRKKLPLGTMKVQGCK